MQQGSSVIEFLESYRDSSVTNIESIKEICDRRGYNNTAYNSMLDVLVSYNEGQMRILNVLIEMENNIIKKS